MPVNSKKHLSDRIQDMLPFSLLMNGVVMSFSYAMLLTNTTPWSLLSDIRTASMMLAILSATQVSCSLRVKDVPLYLFYYMSIIMEPVFYMLLFMLVLSLFGVVTLQFGIVQAVVIMIIVLLINVLYFGLSMLCASWIVELTRQSK